MNQLVKKFRCNQFDMKSFNFILNKDFLIFNLELPQKYKWIYIEDSLGNIILEETFQHHEQVFHLGCPIGKSSYYYLYIYVSNNGVNYICYIGGKQIVLYHSRNNEWFFKLSPYCSWNIHLLKTNQFKYSFNTPLVENNIDITSLAKQITKDSLCTRDKILKIHDWVADNLYYDWDSLRDVNRTNLSLSEIISTRRCVCQGYADLTLELLNSIGIITQNIMCYALNSYINESWCNKKHQIADLNHVITRSYLGNRWLYMDVTWDSFNHYNNGRYLKKGPIIHKYFDITLPLLSSTHRLFKIDQ